MNVECRSIIEILALQTNFLRIDAEIHAIDFGISIWVRILL